MKAAGILKREQNLIGLIDPGVPASAYTTLTAPDPNALGLLGYDNTPVSHMWRTMINPDAPL